MQRLKIIMVGMVLFLTGCSHFHQQEQENAENVKALEVQESSQKEAEFQGMEEEASLDYEVPESVPGLMVDLFGYRTGGAKHVLLHGNRSSKTFRVIEEESGTVVYTGVTEQKQVTGENKEKGWFAYGDFSELTKPGTYYIETDTLGRSYSFQIGDTVYDELFSEVCRQYYYNRCGITLTKEYAGEKAHNACHSAKSFLREDAGVSLDCSGGWHQDEKGQKEVVAASKTIAALLLSYELYPSAFSDHTGIPESGNQIPDLLDELKYETDWLLKMQDAKTGAVYSGISVYEKGASGGSDSYVEEAKPEAEEAFAMALAGFSYVYQSYDMDYSMTCLKAADRAYQHAGLYEDYEEKRENLGLHFAAAAELYRASGESSYQRELNAYFSQEKAVNDKTLLLLKGDVTYLSTKQPVNRAFCEQIMKELMDQAEAISEESRTATYLISDQEENVAELLLNMSYMTVVNHIISNYEYETIVENHLHYFLGRNDHSKEMISEDIMKRFDADGMLVFMLGGIYYNCHELTGM